MATMVTSELEQDLVRWRRTLHARPEPGFCEFRTASLLVRELERLGLDVAYGSEAMDADAAYLIPTERVADWYLRGEEEGLDAAHLARMAGGATAVVAELDASPGPVVAFRFDMDALPVLEADEETHQPVREGYASVHHGYMHACGHDGHMSIGLGVATVLTTARSSLHG